jgi:molybdopterin-guanine dinucleotide biosynthesis protein
MAKSLTVHNLLKKNYQLFDFEGKWFEAFGKPERRGVWIIWGPSGNGKTSFVVQLIKELSQFARVDFISLEEGTSKTLQDKFVEAGFHENHRNVRIIEGSSMREIEEEMSKRRSAEVVIIDSFQYTQMNYREYLEFKNRHQDKTIIFVSHAEGSKPAGRAAVSVMFDAMMKIFVEGYRAITKGRFIGPVGYYTIWEEGADRYWLKGDHKAN